MTFENWLFENSKNIRFTTWASDGTVVVYIDGKRYEYIVDPFYHDDLKKIARYKPFTALNQIKKITS